MDKKEILKLSHRKRMLTESENLNEKVSQEKKKIIKLKVAQDTAYWELKEKLRQVEGNHETLQQNMLDVQMQYEAVSGQCQEELRHRPEILNKLNSNKKICDVLEEYSERLRETVSRCKADQTALSDAYTKSGQVVRDLTLKQQKNEDRNCQVIENLQEKIKTSSAHSAQVQELLIEGSKRVEAENAELRNKLAVAAAQRDELLVAQAELVRKIEQTALENNQKSDMNQTLKNEVKNLLHEFNIQSTEMKNTILNQEKQNKEINVANASLKEALKNQDIYTRSVCEEKNALLEKLAALEEEHVAGGNSIKELQVELKDASATIENIKKELATVYDRNEVLNKELTEKNKLLENAETEIAQSNNQISALEVSKMKTEKELAGASEANKDMTKKLQNLITDVEAMEHKLCEKETMYKDYVDAAESRTKDLTTEIERKEKELASKTSVIARLMADVRSATDVRGQIEAREQRFKNEMQLELQAASERDKLQTKQIEQLEIMGRNKDEEYRKQMNIIMELRKEKERMGEKIEMMRTQMDNIQKEITNPPQTSRAPRLEPPELDDNAIMMMSPRISPHILTPEAPKKKAPTKLIDVYRFSDGSLDTGDDLNRRFKALDAMRPQQAAARKRRRIVGPASAASQAQRENAASANLEESIVPQAQYINLNKERMFFKNYRNSKKGKKAAD